MHTHPATTTMPYLASPEPGRQKPDPLDIVPRKPGFPRGVQTVALSHDMLGAVNASRIAALHGTSMVSNMGKGALLDQIAVQGYSRTLSIVTSASMNASTRDTP